MCYLPQAQESNKAIILGCHNTQDLHDCEEFMNTLSNNPKFYTWYKKRDGGKWVIQLIFPKSLHKDKYIQQWIKHKHQAPNHLMIYTHKQGYNKMHNFKDNNHPLTKMDISLTHKILTPKPK